ncbi:hypothetical protein [Umezawaea sp.]|uniref:hypothetical protein n=1 Tax=Umezawaea sp. TaxID=1955258 RepID=UPI002ED35BC9
MRREQAEGRDGQTGARVRPAVVLLVVRGRRVGVHGGRPRGGSRVDRGGEPVRGEHAERRREHHRAPCEHGATSPAERV